MLNSMHGKGRGKNMKHMGDKKGKAAENMVTRESTKNNNLQINANGNQNGNNIQILKRTNKEASTRKENHDNQEVTMRQESTRDKQGIIGQAPHSTHEGANGINNSHVGLHHMPRPPDGDQLGQIVNQNIIGPNSHEGDTPHQRIEEEDMEIIPETPNLDQQAENAKSMILS
jgi:hypothetical protein